MVEEEKPPWTLEVAFEKAKLLAKKLNITIYLVPTVGAYGQRAWGISRESRSQRAAYEAAREHELKKLHPERYPSPLTSEQELAANNRAWEEEREAEIRRLWEHDNPGLRELYYPVGYPARFFPEND
jgi:hypothetical protein